jgi:cystathionine gamma-synthase
MLRMSARDLLRQPTWQSDELGQPIPPTPHAVSVALPQWQHVVGYEEKKPEVVRHVRTGYPRFVIHPLVAELAQRILPGHIALPFPCPAAAEAAAAFIRRTTGAPVQLSPAPPELQPPIRDTSAGAESAPPQPVVVAVATSAAGEPALRAFWQHSGLIVSSRQAQACLEHIPTAPAAAAVVRQSLRSQLAAWYDCAPDDVFLAPTGMAAACAALQIVHQRTPGQPTVQLGFPYVDTLKLQNKLGAGAILLHDLGRLPEDLAARIAHGPLAACFAEIPGNPLLGCADLRRVSPTLRAHGIPLVADDVVATPANIDLRPYADLIATSLTKFVVGTADAMGGALVCNPHSPLYPELKPIARTRHQELLWEADAAILDAQARGFPERMRQHNANGLFIAERLRQHPAVERAWYPKWEFADAYDAVRRPGGGWGALITFRPRHAETSAPLVYDHLEFCKGPSLGAVFSLACPFTLLAHYLELDWAEACGVSRHLIRLSIGLEEPEELWRRLERALALAPTR